MIYDLALENGTVCNGEELFPANVYIRDEVIELITERKMKFQARQSLDCSGLFLLPGFIDPHVHFDLFLGKYTSRDDFDSGSALALSGGVTTVIDFLDPVRTFEELKEAVQRRMRSSRVSRVDYAFHVTLAGNPEFTPQAIVEAAMNLGMPSIKVFTTYSGSGRRTDDGTLLDLLALSRSSGLVVLAHAENDEIILSRERELRKDCDPTYRDLPHLRPAIAELSEVAKLVLFSKYVDGQLYVVHVSSGDTVKALSLMNTEWKNNTVLETCPQYLMLNDEALGGESGFLNTYCPPARSERERKLLVRGLLEGNIGSIGTDHCPFTTQDKRESFSSIPFGTGSLGLSFSVLNTLFDGDLVKVASLLSINPARLLGLHPERGTLAPGRAANIAVVDRERLYDYSRSPLTGSDHSLFEGISLSGEVVTTVMRGRPAFHENRVLLETGSGKFVERKRVFWGDRSAAE